jgi:hypothetical protein
VTSLLDPGGIFFLARYLLLLQQEVSIHRHGMKSMNPLLRLLLVILRTTERRSWSIHGMTFRVGC